MADLASKTMARLASAPGDYAIWRSKTGAEIWFHVSGARGFYGRLEDGLVLAMTPFYEGDGSIDITVTDFIKRPGDNAFEGAFVAEAMAPAANGSEPFSIVFDAIDYAVHELRTLPMPGKARLVGFCRSLQCFETPAAFAIHRAVEERKADDWHFYAAGLYNAKAAADNDNSATPGAAVPGTARSAVPTSHALVTGRVIAHRFFTNEIAGGSFYWLWIEGRGGTFDLLADPDVVVGDVRDGALIEALCSFNGRMLET
jgi:hypothetical protein